MAFGVPHLDCASREDEVPAMSRAAGDGQPGRVADVRLKARSDLDVRHARRWLRDRLAGVSAPFEMELDRLADERLHIVLGFGYCNAARQIRHIRAVARRPLL